MGRWNCRRFAPSRTSARQRTREIIAVAGEVNDQLVIEQVEHDASCPYPIKPSRLDGTFPFGRRSLKTTSRLGICLFVM
ncbi:hypothetical protein BC629DRAFT_1553127 [Irpex lacteus]|nr:hypothetical protein BC629DRAFT_1553127 [Irpex lacteus]